MVGHRRPHRPEPAVARWAREPRHRTRDRRAARAAVARTATRYHSARPGRGDRPGLPLARPLALRNRNPGVVARLDHPRRTRGGPLSLARPAAPELVLRHSRHRPRTAARRTRTRQPGSAAPCRAGIGLVPLRRNAVGAAHRRVDLPRVGRPAAHRLARRSARRTGAQPRPAAPGTPRRTAAPPPTARPRSADRRTWCQAGPARRDHQHDAPHTVGMSACCSTTDRERTR
jgi:hypothetical protein